MKTLTASLLLLFVTLSSLHATRNSCGSKKKSPFYKACEEGCLESAEAFFNEETFDQSSGYGITPLCEAALRGHLHIVEFLVEKEANVLFQDRNKNSVLMHALAHCCNEDEETGEKEYVQKLALVTYLLKHGAGKKLALRDNAGLTALHKAAELDSETNPSANAILRLLLTQKCIRINSKVTKSVSWAKGSTALHIAAYRGDLPKVEILIQKGACIDNTSRYDNSEKSKTPEELAREEGHHDVADYLAAIRTRQSRSRPQRRKVHTDRYAIYIAH